mmetsp:Transcript_6665/g.9412  ORF Transcript_6665/g.9412 Transcript_6665/m.9412 type:complete len:254 (+) Transcript_6665:97-858(+)
MIPPSPSPTSVATPMGSGTRGAFVLLEGVDRCGKTTQCGLLMKHLVTLGVAAAAMRFPDRTTSVGQLINGYLASGQDLDDRAVHLLFSANRWEAAPKLRETLASGKTIVCDRYAYSGVAFSSAKKFEDKNDELTIDWCKSPDLGLPAPDVVIFLDLSQDDAEKRGGYGGERYEKRDMQIRVRERFDELKNIDEVEGRVPWHIVNAAQSIEDVQNDINKIVEKTLKNVAQGKPLRNMWKDGEHKLEVKKEDTTA